MPLVEPWSSSPIDGTKAPMRTCSGLMPEYCSHISWMWPASSSPAPPNSNSRLYSKSPNALPSMPMRARRKLLPEERSRACAVSVAAAPRRKSVLTGPGGGLVIVGGVELHDAVQIGGKLAVGALDRRPAVGDRGDRRRRGRGCAGLSGRLDDRRGIGAGFQLVELGGQRVDLGLQLLDLGVARIGRRRTLGGLGVRSGGDGAQGRSGHQQASKGRRLGVHSRCPR